MQITCSISWIAHRLPGLACLHLKAFSTTIALLRKPTGTESKRWSRAEVDKLLGLRKQGETMQNIRSAFPHRTSEAISLKIRTHCPRDEDGTMLYKDPRYVTESERDQILQLRAEGMPYSEILSKYFPNKTMTALMNLKLRGLNKRPRVWSGQEIRKLHVLHEEQKLPLKEVARALDRSYCSVRETLKRINARKVKRWNHDARKRAIDMIQSGVPLKEVATYLYPDKDLGAACKYLKRMYRYVVSRQK